MNCNITYRSGIHLIISLKSKLYILYLSRHHVIINSLVFEPSVVVSKSHLCLTMKVNGLIYFALIMKVSA